MALGACPFSSFIIAHLWLLVKNFFRSFWRIFRGLCCSLTGLRSFGTSPLYHIFVLLSRGFFDFLKSFFSWLLGLIPFGTSPLYHIWHWNAIGKIYKYRWSNLLHFSERNSQLGIDKLPQVWYNVRGRCPYFFGKSSKCTKIVGFDEKNWWYCLLTKFPPMPLPAVGQTKERPQTFIISHLLEFVNW